MRLLVVSPEPVDADAVRAACPGDALDDAEVMVVSPAVNRSPVRFWMSDSDKAIDRADAAQAETVGDLRDDGVRARGVTGDSEPLQAVRDALATFPADRVLLFVRDGDEQAYREDELEAAADDLGVPVERHTLPAG